MPWFEIYKRSGDEFGEKLSQEDMQEIVDNYDAEYREAPLVIGHPKTDDPAYGWVKKLMIKKDSLLALIEKIPDKLVKAINEGMFKKISISWVTIKNKGLYLWHVGLLGAEKPAVAGLAPVQLSASDMEGEIMSCETDIWPEPFLKLTGKKAAVPSEIPLADEGEAWSWSWADDADAIIGRYGWKGLAAVCAYVNREFETDQKEDGLPAVKGAYKLPFATIIGGQLKVVWRGVAAAMAAVMGARQEIKISEEDRRKAFDILARQYKRFDKPAPEFKSIEEGGSEMAEVAELQSKVTELEGLLKVAEEEGTKVKTEKETLEKRHAELRGQIEQEREEAWVETQVKEGKILPAWNERGLVDFLLSLDDTEIETKSADGKMQKTGQRAMFKSLVESLAAAIDFNEVAIKEKAAEGEKVEGGRDDVKAGKKEQVDSEMAVFDKQIKAHMKQHSVTYEKAVEALKIQLR